MQALRSSKEAITPRSIQSWRPAARRNAACQEDVVSRDKDSAMIVSVSRSLTYTYYHDEGNWADEEV